MFADQSEQTENLGTRSRTRTERGAEYDVSLYEQKFKQPFPHGDVSLIEHQ